MLLGVPEAAETVDQWGASMNESMERTYQIIR